MRAATGDLFTQAESPVADHHPGKASDQTAEYRKSDDDDQNKIEPVHKDFPVSAWYACLYFSLVLSATSGGSPGAGGCLFQWMDSR